MTAEEENLENRESVYRFERADWLIPSGVFVVTLQSGRGVNAYTAAWVVRVSENPVMVQVAVWEKNYSYKLAQTCRHFVVHILASGQQDTALHFGRCSGRDLDKLKGYSIHLGVSGVPILDDCLAFMECVVVVRRQFGDHMILVGKVINSKINRVSSPPLLYKRKDYPARRVT